MRYLPLTADDRAIMLRDIGASTVDDLFCDVPSAARDASFDLPDHQSERAVERHMARLAGRNVAAGSAAFFCGAGAYRHHIPASVDHIIQRGEFLTAYTPYQPEIAQGTLHYLFEFQTQVARLLGMPVANASLYDGSTACGEAVLMARRVTRRKRAILAGNLHAHYADVVETMTRFTDDEIVRQSANPADPSAVIEAATAALDDATSCVVIQTPDVFGHLHDLQSLADAVHTKGALLVVVVTEIVSLGLIKSPGDMGADIVVAEGQSIGNGLNFGGPYLGLMATRDKLVRQMPGRLCGETVDADGKRGFVLTLSTREQHIRREKATSNICTNSGLCALAFSAHMTLLGGRGLHQLAALNHSLAVQTFEALSGIPGVEVLNTTFFNEMTVRLPTEAAPLVDSLVDKGVIAGVPVSRLFPDQGFDDCLLVAVTELVDEADIELLASSIADSIGGR